jgi:hypothetical protein
MGPSNTNQLKHETNEQVGKYNLQGKKKHHRKASYNRQRFVDRATWEPLREKPQLFM